MKKIISTLLMPLMLLCGSMEADLTHFHKVGQIGFDNLRVKDVVIGVFDYERNMVQDLIFDLRVTFDVEAVAAVDTLEVTVDYVKLAEVVESEARKGEHYFLDTLSLATLKRIFAAFPEVVEATITIHKPAAIPEAATGGVLHLTLDREKLARATTLEGPIMAQIGFNSLYVHTVIGDLPIERENAQDLYVDARATIDLTPLLRAEKLDSTVDYQQMARLFQEVADEGKYQMVETLSVNYMNKLLERYKQIDSACVLIRKPGTLPGYPFSTDAITTFHVSR